MFKQFFEVFLPKTVKYVAAQGLNNVKNMKDFERNLEDLRKNLKLLSAKSCDVEEEIKNGERSGRKKRKREVEEWLEDVKSIEMEVGEMGSEVESQGFIMRLMDGGKAAQLNLQVEKLVQQRLDFGEPVLDDRGTREEILLTNGMVGEAFNENLETILKLLDNSEVSKIGVYGMGGVGKTTLAKHVYNRLMQQSEGRVLWVTVSQEFTITSLQDKIARCLGIDLSNEDEEAIRAGRLNRFLSQMKNSVLILDDVWEKIDMLKVGCTFSVEFCRLIITTRSLEVCRRIGCKKLIPVVKLSKDEAWMLFNETLENETTLGIQVEEIAKSMAGLCDGLPLGIITVAGSMKGETTIHTWQNALAELKVCVAGGQDEMGEVDEVFKVLKYSFDRLNRNYQSESNEFNMFQLCFMYCSLYPEDYEIVRHELVGKFISEGLVDEKKSRRAQVQQGHSILDKLVNLCLLENCVNFENMKCVKMHDLVRSMALKIHKGKYMVRAFDRSLLDIFEEEWKKDLEKVSFMKSGTYRIGEGISPDCPKLSTLLLWGNYNLKVIPESFFSKLQGLCTLDLCRTGIKKLPNSVFDLTSLKALLLENCRGLETVPYVGKLKALRELNLSNTAIKEAPQGLEELLNLRFLSINAPQLKIIPGGLLLNLEHLQHLNLPLHMQVVIDEIKNLKQLEEFRGAMKSVGDFNSFVKTRVVHDPYYRIQVNSNFNTGHSGFGIEEDLGSGTNELMFSYCNLKDEKVLGQGIAYLTIRECNGVSKCFVDDLASRFDNPTSLRKLKIMRCGGIDWILRSDGHGSYVNTLEEIQLAYLDDMKGVVMATAPTQSLVFSSLKWLHIDECSKMRKVGLPVSALPNLEFIRIRTCEEIEEILEGDEGGAASILTTLPRLKQLWLHELPRLRKVGLPVWVVPNLEEIHIRNCGEIEEILEEDETRAASILTTLTLPKLKELSLCELPRLKSVSNTTIISNSIQTIFIRKCPRLKNKLPLHFDDLTPPPTLESIWVEREWWESLEWDTNIHPNLPQLLLPLVEFQDR